MMVLIGICGTAINVLLFFAKCKSSKLICYEMQVWIICRKSYSIPIRLLISAGVSRKVGKVGKVAKPQRK